jgi:hypothetical protein
VFQGRTPGEARERVVFLERADKSERCIRKRPGVVKKGNFSRTPGLPFLVCFRFTGCE